MDLYYAITRRDGRWEYVSSGADPDEALRGAQETIQERETFPGEEAVDLEPDTETRLGNLRVVPAAIARERYHIVFPREASER